MSHPLAESYTETVIEVLKSLLCKCVSCCSSGMHSVQSVTASWHGFIDRPELAGQCLVRGLTGMEVQKFIP